MARTSKPSGDQKHKAARRRVYNVTVNLVIDEDSPIYNGKNGVVTRHLRVPGNTTVDELHNFVLNPLDCFDETALYFLYHSKQMAGKSLIYVFDFDQD